MFEDGDQGPITRITRISRINTKTNIADNTDVHGLAQMNGREVCEVILLAVRGVMVNCYSVNCQKLHFLLPILGELFTGGLLGRFFILKKLGVLLIF